MKLTPERIILLHGAWTNQRQILWEDYCNETRRVRQLANENEKSITAQSLCERLLEVFGANYSKAMEKTFLRHSSRVERWFDYGVLGVFLGSSRLPQESTSQFPVTVYTLGNMELMWQATATVLNSRKPRLLHASDPWLLATKKLSSLAMERKKVIVSSLGTQGYDILSCIAWIKKHPLIVVLDRALPPMCDTGKRERFLKEYGWLRPSDHVLLVSPFPSERILSRKKRMLLRDTFVSCLSDWLLVGAIRRKGNMFEMSQVARKQGKKLSVWNPGKFDKETEGNQVLLREGIGVEHLCLHVSLEPETLNLEERRTREDKADERIVRRFPPEYLIHFTRSCPGPWPGQKKEEYLSSLVRGTDDSYHSGFHTLLNILKEGTIHSSNRMYRGNVPVVSFTACRPEELSGISFWNQALVRWTFEPYGIAFPKHGMLHLGAKPVVYASEDLYKEMNEEDKYLFQLHVPPKTNWMQEKEWRIRGDVELSDFEDNEIIVLVSNGEEAREILQRFPYMVFVVQDSTP